MDLQVAALAKAKSSPFPPYRFLEQAKLTSQGELVGLVGRVEYTNRFCQILAAIVIDHWTFCIEKMIVSEPHFGAFHNGVHYGFGPVPLQPDQSRQEQLIQFCAERILPVLRPSLDCANLTVE